MKSSNHLFSLPYPSPTFSFFSILLSTSHLGLAVVLFWHYQGLSHFCLFYNQIKFPMLHICRLIPALENWYSAFALLTVGKYSLQSCFFLFVSNVMIPCYLKEEFRWVALSFKSPVTQNHVHFSLLHRWIITLK